MGVTRILDLAALILLTVVLLIPRPSVGVKPALKVQPELAERAGELQAVLMGAPGALGPSLELANIYLDGHRPDWALATIAGALQQDPRDYRVQLVRAIAYADRFESQPAFDAAKEALALCEAAPPAPAPGACGEGERGRLNLLKTTLESVATLEMRKQLPEVQDRILKNLRSTYVPLPKAKKPAAKEAGSPNPPAPQPAKP